MALRRKLQSSSQILADWTLPGLAMLLVGLFMVSLYRDLHCGPVGWITVICVCTATLLTSASILDTGSPVAGMEISRRTRILLLCSIYALAFGGQLFTGATLGVWVASIVTFGGMLAYLLQSKPSGRNLFYQCSRCAAMTPPPRELVSGL